MWRIFSLAILALIPVGRVGAQDKRSLIVEVLQTAGDYGDIAPVWGIVQKDGDIYRFVPSVAPLKEKYRISDRYGYRTHPISGERQFHAVPNYQFSTQSTPGPSCFIFAPYRPSPLWSS